MKIDSGFKKNSSSNLGFTLIELIIVFSVLAILSIVGIVAFTSYSRKQTLNAAAGDLSVMFNLAKSRAYSQIKPANASCSSNALEGYEIRICGGTPSCISPGATYELNVKCGGYTPVNQVTIPSSTNLTFTSGSNPAVYSFFFPVLKGGVVGSGDIKISNNLNEFKTVTIDSSGNIRVN